MTLTVLIGLIGLALVIYAGQLALMPVVTLGVLIWILERPRWERKLFRYAYAAGGAYAFWAIAGIFLQGRSAADWAVEGVVAALPLIWLWAKPASKVAVCVCLFVFIAELAITGISLALVRMGSEAHKVLVVHATLKAIVLVSLVAGLFRTRRSPRTVPEGSAP